MNISFLKLINKWEWNVVRRDGLATTLSCVINVGHNDFNRTHITFQLAPRLSKFKINVCHLKCSKLMCHVNILLYSTFVLELIWYLNLAPTLNL